VKKTFFFEKKNQKTFGILREFLEQPRADHGRVKAGQAWIRSRLDKLGVPRTQ